MPDEKLGVKVDVTSAVDEAYAVGREGWVGKRVFNVLRFDFGGST